MEITESHKHETYGGDIFEYRLQVKVEADSSNILKLNVEGENKAQAINKMIDLIGISMKRLKEAKSVLNNT